jgi:uncharacterized membrane protein
MGALMALLIGASLVMVGCGQVQQDGGNQAQQPNTSTAAPSQQAAEVSREAATPEGQNVVIATADITGQARFYPTTAAGTSLEILAIRAADGSIRTAFNTCQICFDSGRGYYVQEGNVLVCQNCGNRFSAERVEVESGGCNPVPIFADDKIVGTNEIVIPAASIAQAQQIFAHWKR